MSENEVVHIQLKFKEFQGSAKSYGQFRYLAPSKEAFLAAGFSEEVSENLEYLLKAQLGTHNLKESYKKDVATASGLTTDLGKKKDYTDAEKSAARKNLTGVYAYDFSNPPKQRAGTKWGPLAPYIQRAKNKLKELDKELSDANIRQVAEKLQAVEASLNLDSLFEEEE